MASGKVLVGDEWPTLYVTLAGWLYGLYTINNFGANNYYFNDLHFTDKIKNNFESLQSFLSDDILHLYIYNSGDPDMISPVNDKNSHQIKEPHDVNCRWKCRHCNCR